MKKTVIAVVAIVVVLVAAGGTAWALTGDGESKATGRCGQTVYQLTAEKDDDMGDGALEVSFELQSAAPGETWQVQVEQDGTQRYDGSRTTDEDGEVDLDVSVDESDGSTFVVTATPQGQGDSQPCTARLER